MAQSAKDDMGHQVQLKGILSSGDVFWSFLTHELFPQYLFVQPENLNGNIYVG